MTILKCALSNNAASQLRRYYCFGAVTSKGACPFCILVFCDYVLALCLLSLAKLVQERATPHEECAFQQRLQPVNLLCHAFCSYVKSKRRANRALKSDERILVTLFAS